MRDSCECLLSADPLPNSLDKAPAGDAEGAGDTGHKTAAGHVLCATIGAAPLSNDRGHTGNKVVNWCAIGDCALRYPRELRVHEAEHAAGEDSHLCAYDKHCVIIRHRASLLSGHTSGQPIYTLAAAVEPQWRCIVGVTQFLVSLAVQAEAGIAPMRRRT